MSFNVITKFENEVAKFFGAPHAVAVDCCTHGIELCLRQQKIKSITVPKRTYLSIPFLADKLGIELKWKEENWKDFYQIGDTNIYDAAVLWEKDSYIPGTFMCLSFQFRKHLSLGRGGMILCDNKNDYQALKKMVYDGRDPNIPWRDQNIDMIGYHYYMTPETAQLGLDKLQTVISTKPKQWVVTDWPDVSKMDIFQKDNITNMHNSDNYWNKIYNNNKITLKGSPFAKFCMQYLEKDYSILDIGCGNGRDSMFFADMGINVNAIDRSTNIIETLRAEKTRPNLSFHNMDVKSLPYTRFDKMQALYCRFFLHSISFEDEITLLEYAYDVLAPGGLLMIETRSILDKDLNKHYNDHSRRYNDIDTIQWNLSRIGFVVEHQEHGQGLSPYKSEDPYLIRLIAKKGPHI